MRGCVKQPPFLRNFENGYRKAPETVVMNESANDAQRLKWRFET